MKNKKIIIGIIVAIIAIALIVGAIFYFISNNENKNSEGNISKISKLYETLEAKNEFSFSLTEDDNNKMFYAKQDGKAYVDTIDQGNRSKFVLKDGNAYLLIDSSKRYFTYVNNQTDLEKVTAELSNLIEREYETGKDKINNKTYEYLEVEGATRFSIKYLGEESAKTRFYFNKDKLVYIETIVGEDKELLEVEISNKVDSNLFNIPSDYQEG